MLFPKNLSLRTPLLPPSLLPPFSVSPAGPLPRPSLGMPCLLSLPLLWTPFSCSLSFSELPSSSGGPSAADQVRAVQGSYSALCSCHHPASINNFSPALKGKYYYSKHVTRQDKHTLLPSLSERPTLCCLLSVSAGVISPRSPPHLALPTTSCAGGQPVAMPAGCAAHTGCLIYSSWVGVYPTWSPKLCQRPWATSPCSRCSSNFFYPRDITPSLGPKAGGGRAAQPPLQNLLCPPPRRRRGSREPPQSCGEGLLPCALGWPPSCPLAGLLRAGRLGQAPAHGCTGTTNSRFPGWGAACSLQSCTRAQLAFSFGLKTSPSHHHHLCSWLYKMQTSPYLWATCSWDFPPSALRASGGCCRPDYVAGKGTSTRARMGSGQFVGR